MPPAARCAGHGTRRGHVQGAHAWHTRRWGTRRGHTACTACTPCGYNTHHGCNCGCTDCGYTHCGYTQHDHTPQAAAGGATACECGGLTEFLVSEGGGEVTGCAPAALSLSQGGTGQMVSPIVMRSLVLAPGGTLRVALPLFLGVKTSAVFTLVQEVGSIAAWSVHGTLESASQPAAAEEAGSGEGGGGDDRGRALSEANTPDAPPSPPLPSPPPSPPPSPAAPWTWGGGNQVRRSR